MSLSSYNTSSGSGLEPSRDPQHIQHFHPSSETISCEHLVQQGCVTVLRIPLPTSIPDVSFPATQPTLSSSIPQMPSTPVEAGEPEAWSGTFQQQMQILTQSSDMRPGREPPGGRQEPEVKKHESSEGSCRDREQGPGSPRQTRSQPPRLVGFTASTEGSGSEPADTFSLCHHHFSFLVMFESKFLSPASNGAFAKVTSTSLCSMHL